MESKPFKHYIPYILGGVLGLFFRTVIYAVRGMICTMDGHDILNAVLFVLIVYCVYGILDAIDVRKK